MKNSKFKKVISLSLFILLAIIIFSGCARSEPVDACLEGRTYGFLYGLLHGFLAPLDLIAMFFNDKYTVYAQNNTGAFYAFGFLLGSGGWGFLGGKKLCGKKN
jgi:hypothetical protein